MFSAKHYAAKSEKSSIKSEEFALQARDYAEKAQEAEQVKWNIFDVVARDYELSFESKWGFEKLGDYVYKNAVAGEHYGYPDFYETCVRELNECPEGEETIIGNFSVTLYKHPNGHVFYNDFVEGEFVDGIFGEQGEAWYYGIDIENERIKLPRSTKRFEDLSDNSFLYMVVGNVKNDDLSWVDIITQVDKGVKDIADTEANILENIQRAEEVALGNIEEQSFSVRNIGDIFYTNRIQDNLNGAVECDGKLYKFVDFTGDQTVENLLKQEKLPYISLSEYDLWMKGEPLNVEVVGSPKVENGIASKFSDSSYLLVPKVPENMTSFELLFKINLNSITSHSLHPIVVQKTTNLKTPQLIIDGQVFWFGVCQDAKNWIKITGGKPEINKDYWVKATWDGAQIELLISENNLTFTSLGTAAVTKPDWSEQIRIGDDQSTSDFFDGSIDITESYIKINGEMWWQGGRGLEAHDSCRRFGWDGGEATEFRVPTIKGVSRTLVAQKLPSLADPSWFDWYSDGWLEQGGVYNHGSLVKDWPAVSISYLKPFLDKTYLLNTQAGRNDGGTGGINNQSFVTKYSETGFTFEVYGDGNSQYLWWEAEGYSAIPSSEYWNYQDVSNIKCMVQIANGKADVSMWDYNRQLQETTDEHIADIMSAGESIARYQQPIVEIKQTSGDVTLKTTNIYTMVIDGNTKFILPTKVDTRFYNQIQVCAEIVGLPEIDWGTDILFNREPIEIGPGFFDFHFDYDNLQQAWVVGYTSKGTLG